MVASVWRRFVQQLNKGSNWLELVFLPLYGKETGKRRSAMVEEMLDFEIELFRAEKISERLLAAAIVMSNKMVDQKFFEDNLEVLKMIDVIDVARKHGLEEGRTLGSLETSQKMLLNLLMKKFGGLPSDLTESIKKINDLNLLEFFFNKAMECESVQAFKQILSQPE